MVRPPHTLSLGRALTRAARVPQPRNDVYEDDYDDRRDRKKKRYYECACTLSAHTHACILKRGSSE